MGVWGKGNNLSSERFSPSPNEPQTIYGEVLMSQQITAHSVGDHIDTDAIIPAKFLVTTDTAELGANCMEGLEPGWIKRVAKGDVIVAGENFGCGSSREHAPIAIIGAGIPIVIAKSFARIFYRNAINMGLVLLEIGDQADKIQDGDPLRFTSKRVRSKMCVPGKASPLRRFLPLMHEILDKGGWCPLSGKN